MYVCIDQNCGVTTEGEEEEEEEEANISLFFYPLRQKKGSQSMDRYFSLFYDEKRNKEKERERETAR
jgi:hypothetical protein